MAANNKNVSGADEMIRKLEQVKEYIENDVPVVIGVESVRYSQESFQTESFDGKKWASRSTKRKGSTNNQKVLTKSGELGDANSYRVNGRNVTITNDKPYAEIHNEGFNGNQSVPQHTRKVKGKVQQVKAHTRNMKMPQRQFIGQSDELDNRIIDKVTRDIDKILK